jgi:hypothetical protein
MKAGDLVMFIDEGRYAKWFYGKFATVEQSTKKSKSCRVRWLEPVRYYASYTAISDFHWKDFEICEPICEIPTPV